MGEYLQKESHGSTIPKMRNPAIECCRILASIAVIFSHCKFPGTFGSIVDCLDRFSVPFFFMVSGYFVYQAGENTIKKRTRGILRLNIMATVLYILWGIYKEKYIYGQSSLAWLREKITIEKFSRWFINCENPFSEHLWYLTAILVCYFVIGMYVRWYNKPYHYDSLYIVSLCLYIVHVVLGSGASAAGVAVPYVIYRNALFYGLPMFSLGIFIREYGSHILKTYNLTTVKLIGIIIAGAAFSIMEWLGTGKGIVEMPFGTLFEVIALMLLLTSMPQKTIKNKAVSAMVSQFADLSAYIYITHIIWKKVYEVYIKQHLLAFMGDRIDYIRPIMVALISIATGCIWLLLKAVMKKVAAKSHVERKR